MNTKFNLILVFLLFVKFSFGQSFGELTDSRDNQTYKTVTIDIPLEGGITIQRTWMAENLNYNIEDSYCYRNEEAYCEVYGRLYTFEAAVNACPSGWHMPTIDEWNLMFTAFGGIRNAGVAIQKEGKSGLDLLLAGYGDPGSIFKNIGLSGNYWDAEKKSSKTAGLISITKNTQEVFHSAIGNWHRNSCRCVKDK